MRDVLIFILSWILAARAGDEGDEVQTILLTDIVNGVTTGLPSLDPYPPCGQTVLTTTSSPRLPHSILHQVLYLQAHAMLTALALELFRS